jgi:hypothetical protein
MFIPDPGHDFYPFRIPDLGSRIQKQQQKKGVKKNLLSATLAIKIHITAWLQTPNTFSTDLNCMKLTSEHKIKTQKNLHKKISSHFVPCEASFPPTAYSRPVLLDPRPVLLNPRPVLLDPRPVPAISK